MRHSVQGQLGPMSLRTWRCAVSIGLALTAVPCPSAAQQVSPKLTAVDHEMMVSAAEIQNWLDRRTAGDRPIRVGRPGRNSWSSSMPR
jgi:hypothetical protein